MKERGRPTRTYEGALWRNEARGNSAQQKISGRSLAQFRGEGMGVTGAPHPDDLDLARVGRRGEPADPVASRPDEAAFRHSRQPGGALPLGKPRAGQARRSAEPRISERGIAQGQPIHGAKARGENEKEVIRGSHLSSVAGI